MYSFITPMQSNTAIQPYSPMQQVCSMNPSLDQETVNRLYVNLLYQKNQLEGQLAVINARAANDYWMLQEKMAENYQLQQQKHEAEKELLHLKQEHEKKIQNMKDAQLKGMIRWKEEKEQATVAAVLDSDGFFCIEIQYPTRDKEVTNPVLQIDNLHMTRLVDIESGECVGEKVSWDNDRKSFILLLDQRSPDFFKKEIENSGACIAVIDKKKQKTYATLIYAFLIKHSVTIEIPARWGWNKTYHGWVFVSGGLTCDDLRRQPEVLKNEKSERRIKL